MQSARMKTEGSETDAFEEIVLLQQLDSIVNLSHSGSTYPVEERFDIAFLHAASLPFRQEGTDISQVFDDDRHEHRVIQLNYLTKVFFANMNRGNRYPWSSLAAESIGPLDRRRLFSDIAYRAYIFDEYLQLLRSGILD